MESEAVFLFVVCRPEPLDPVHKDGKVFQDFLPIIRRLSLQKPERPRNDTLYKRINVEFDPLDHVNDAAYVVVIQGKVETPEIVTTNVFHFPAITLTKQEADEVKVRIDGGEHRNYLDRKKHEKFVKCEVMIAAVTKV